MHTRVIAKNVWDPFLWYTVYMLPRYCVLALQNLTKIQLY